MENKYKRVKLACYAVNISMAIVSNLPPLLFLTFRSMYGLSYSLLGLLVVINFFTQLGIDLVFSFFSHKFNIPKAVKLTPVLTVAGLLIYALSPFIAGDFAYVCLVLGTVIFAASGGLVEVLISPVIAAIPSDNPEREMSKLHSIYAWGVVGIIAISTVYILIFGTEAWQWLVTLLAIIPLVSAILFAGAEIPPMETPKKTSGAFKLLKNKSMWLCILAIFLGGASECTMAQWASGYLERAIGISKVWGDLFGAALFGFMLGLGRTLYAKRGVHIERVLCMCAVGATLCYMTAAISPVPVVGLIGCGMTGLCTSMMWPGCLIVAADRFPKGGVFIYAVMAAGGDFGASVGPQLVGLVTDGVMNGNLGFVKAQDFGITSEQLGMKMGMLVAMLFALAAIPVYIKIWKSRKVKEVQK